MWSPFKIFYRRVLTYIFIWIVLLCDGKCHCKYGKYCRNHFVTIKWIPLILVGWFEPFRYTCSHSKSKWMLWLTVWLLIQSFWIEKYFDLALNYKKLQFNRHENSDEQLLGVELRINRVQISRAQPQNIFPSHKQYGLIFPDKQITNPSQKVKTTDQFCERSFGLRWRD